MVRRTAAVVLSAAILFLLGLRNMLLLFGGTLLLWVPMQLMVNTYCVRRLPLKLIPWTPPKRRGRTQKNPLWDPDVPELFDHRQK